jgi:hypothetical protein
LKGQLKEKINWNQFDLVMVRYFVYYQKGVILMNVFKGQKIRQPDRHSIWESLGFSKNQERHLHLNG